MQVGGIISVGEAAPVAARVLRRICGPLWLRGVMAAGPPVIVGLLAAVGEDLLLQALGRPSPDLLIGYFVGVVLGWMAWRPFYRKWMVARGRKRFAERGQDRELPTSIEVEPTGLRYAVGAVETRAQWSAVTDLFHVPGYWVFFVQGASMYVPDRFFPDAEAQRAFIGEALAHMTEASRKRSPDAEAFARPKAA
jgi:hypothetical protein